MGQPGHPEVQKVIMDGIATVRAASILATDPRWRSNTSTRARCS